MKFTDKSEEDEFLRARRLTLALLKPTFVLNMAVGVFHNPKMSKSAHTRALKAAREINEIVKRHQ